VANQQHGSLKLVDRLYQRINGLHIQVLDTKWKAFLVPNTYA
jgi:hypothetical protein